MVAGATTENSNGSIVLNGRPVIIEEKPCPCGDPIESSWIVTCSVCKRWYHAKCISLSDNMRKLVEKMACNKCVQSYRVESQFKTKCRLPECFEAVDDESGEFCSSDHRIQFWKRAVEALNSDQTNGSVMKWLCDKNLPENYKDFVEARPDAIINDTDRSEKVPEELAALSQLLQTAIENRAGSGECGFDPKLTGLEGDICSNSPNCRTHRGWVDMVSKKIKLYGETRRQRLAPDAEHVARRAKTLVMGTTRFSERHVRRVAYLIPYVWDEDDKDYYIHGNPESFWAREF